MSAIWKLLEWINKRMKDIGVICLAGMMLLTCADVVCRAFGHPIFGAVEIVGFLSTLTVVMALPYTHQQKAHIGVEMLVRLFPVKTQAVIELCTGVLSMALMGLITWRMADYAYTMQASGEVSISLELPEHAIIYITSFCFLVFSCMIITDMLRCIQKLREGKK